MPPLNLYAHVRISLCILPTRPRVHRAPGIPCALLFSRVNPIKTRAHRVARPRSRALHEAKRVYRERAAGHWLGFLDTFRTLCVAPPAEIRSTFEQLRSESGTKQIHI